MLNALVTLAAEEAPKNPILPEPYDLIWSALFFVLILILIVRPTGLLGERVADKI